MNKLTSLSKIEIKLGTTTQLDKKTQVHEIQSNGKSINNVSETTLWPLLNLLLEPSYIYTDPPSNQQAIPHGPKIAHHDSRRELGIIPHPSR